MSKATREPGLPGNKLVTSFLLSLVLIGSTISSALLLGLTIYPQQAWATAPAKVVLTSPTDGTITNDDTPTFTWNRLTGANAPTSYKIQVDNSGSSFPSPEVDQSVPQPSSGGSVSFTAPTLALGTYTWRVQGINADGSGAFSDPRTVTIALTSPTLVTPSNGATTNDQTPIFTWNRVTGASSYQLQVDTSNSGPSANCSPNVPGQGGFRPFCT